MLLLLPMENPSFGRVPDMSPVHKCGHSWGYGMPHNMGRFLPRPMCSRRRTSWKPLNRRQDVVKTPWPLTEENIQPPMWKSLVDCEGSSADQIRVTIENGEVLVHIHQEENDSENVILLDIQKKITIPHSVDSSTVSCRLYTNGFLLIQAEWKNKTTTEDSKLSCKTENKKETCKKEKAAKSCSENVGPSAKLPTKDITDTKSMTNDTTENNDTHKTSYKDQQENNTPGVAEPESVDEIFTMNEQTCENDQNGKEAENVADINFGAETDRLEVEYEVEDERDDERDDEASTEDECCCNVEDREEKCFKEKSSDVHDTEQICEENFLYKHETADECFEEKCLHKHDTAEECFEEKCLDGCNTDEESCEEKYLDEEDFVLLQCEIAADDINSEEENQREAGNPEIPVHDKTASKIAEDTKNQFETEDISKKFFTVSFDLQKYKPSEISVKVQENLVKVSAEREIRGDNFDGTEVFKRHVYLPDAVDPSSVFSKLQEDGSLIIGASYNTETGEEIVLPV